MSVKYIVHEISIVTCSLEYFLVDLKYKSKDNFVRQLVVHFLLTC